MFFLLAFLMSRTFFLGTLPKGKAMLLVFFICMAYGAGLEYAQGQWFEGRDCDVLDWFADMAGTTMAILVARWRWVTSRR